MSKENLEQFMKPVAESKELQAKIGEEITGDALVALGATDGCGFSIDDVTDKAELSGAEIEEVSGGISATVSHYVRASLMDQMKRHR